MNAGAPSPTVYVVAGPNGAGKTTFSTKFLPDYAKCREFLNADLIAAGLAPFAPETQNIRAARLLLIRMRELAANRCDFGFETTLAGRTYVKQLNDLKNRGYRTVLYFLWLPTMDHAVARVAARVKQGGHHVPELDVRRRYASGLNNLFTIYRSLLNEWRLFDSSTMPPRLILTAEDQKTTILNEVLYQKVLHSIQGQPG